MAINKHIWEKLSRHKGKSKVPHSQVNNEPENQAEMAAMQSLWDKTELSQGDYEPDAQKGWESLMLKATMRGKTSPSYSYYKVAAAVAILIAAIFIFRVIDTEQIKILAENQVTEISLPDGSTVWLNKHATLSYPERFSQNSRDVQLTGEAFFFVKKAEGKPFTIYTKHSKTRVLGTSFNVSAWPDQPVRVQVKTGKVAFSDLKAEKMVLLAPGEEASLSGGILETGQIEDPNYLAWKNKQLIFQNTSIDEVAFTLKRYFGIDLLISPGLEQCRFTSTFNNPDVEQVMEVLALVGNFTITKQSETKYLLSGESCN